jgi:hypothetical protein
MTDQQKIIIDARKDSDGDISHVLYDGNSNYTSLERAIEMADQNKIKNAHAVHPQGRRPYLRSNPDGKKKNNLDYMAGDY